MKLLIASTGMYCHNAQFLVVSIKVVVCTDTLQLLDEFFLAGYTIHEVILSLVSSVVSAVTIGDLKDDPSFLSQVLSWLFSSGYENERIPKC